ncbi:MAG: glycosyltransferase [bacterium]
MDKIRVAMSPHPDKIDKNASSGIAQVVLNWARHLPAHGIEIVPDGHPADVTIGHVTANVEADIHVSHGLLWTEEFDLKQYAYEVNRDLVIAAKNAMQVIVPSMWVADVYRRDMHLTPNVIRHGVNVEEWLPRESEGYVLYTKNRTSDGLNPDALNMIAREMPHVKFVTTFATKDSPPNVHTLGGTVPHAEMKRHIENAAVVLMTDRETWGIAAAEALAAGVPVVSTDRGAVKDFVEHGRTGYLYKSRYIEDAKQGIRFCLTYGEILGKNARCYAEEYLTWDYPAERVAEIIREVNFQKNSVRNIGVGVVITSHNYGDKVGKAIESVMGQTYQNIEEIIVVDDSSDEADKTFEVVNVFDGEPGPHVAYRRVEFGNVALARNHGMNEVSGTYIVSLDGDDWLRPEWVADCVSLLEEDKHAGFAYGGSEVVLKDGEILMPPELAEQTGLRAHRPWPTEDHDKQFFAGNQYPSGIMFRKVAFDRVMGYRARYAQHGAGTEDAHLTLSLLSRGWTGRMTTPNVNNLWVHTDGFGHVSGDSEYEEANWRVWFPWTEDYRFPFAAVATPKYLSHPVRSYEPYVSVIIPVGPAHEATLVNALDSLEAQKVRNWEAIVVFDYQPGFDVLKRFMTAYPFVQFIESNGTGPGRARNLGVSAARADYITFLDADDYYSPNFFNHVNPRASKDNNAVVYSRYFSKMTREQHAKYSGTIVKEDGDIVAVDYAFRPFDSKRAMQRPDGDRPYVWSGVNVLLPKKWHYEIGGFREDMASWEDCLYLLRLAWKGYTFHLIDEPLWVYSFTDGTRRSNSNGMESGLMTIFQDEYDRMLEGQYDGM